MTDNTQTPEAKSSDTKHTPFSKRLRNAREALGLERKDVGAQLHLNEKIIIMMENDRYPIDLPPTFIRGYLRSYAKLLQIPEYETRQAVDAIKSTNQQTLNIKPSSPLTSNNYFMQLFTYLIILTVVGLVGAWWHTHSMPPLSTIAKNTLLYLPAPVNENKPIQQVNNTNDAVTIPTTIQQAPISPYAPASTSSEAQVIKPPLAPVIHPAAASPEAKEPIPAAPASSKQAISANKANTVLDNIDDNYNDAEDTNDDE